MLVPELAVPQTMPTTQSDIDLIWSFHNNPLNSVNYCYKSYYWLCPLWTLLFLILTFSNLKSSWISVSSTPHGRWTLVAFQGLPLRHTSQNWAHIWSEPRKQSWESAPCSAGSQGQGWGWLLGSNFWASHFTYSIFSKLLIETLERARQCSRSWPWWNLPFRGWSTNEPVDIWHDAGWGGREVQEDTLLDQWSRMASLEVTFG